MASLDDIVSVGKLLNINLAQLVTTIQRVFPAFTTSSATATSGSATLPGNPVGFITITDAGGELRKIPYYNP